MAVRVQEATSLRLDEIYRYSRDRWGTEQAHRYIIDLFAAFDHIQSHGVASRPIPAEFGVEGFTSGTRIISCTGGVCRMGTSAS